MQKHFLLIPSLFSLFSCFPASDEHRQEGKVFHASVPGSGAVGGLYFALYNDHTYQICATGGIGQYCYEGRYILEQDTLVLTEANKYVGLKSNKLLISRYPAEENGSLGEVTQLDSLNRKILGTNENNFAIRMDSLASLR